MRHLVGIVLAVAAAVVIFFAGGWGYLRLLRPPDTSGALASLPAGGGSLLHDRHALTALAALAAVGLIIGLIIAIPWVSPLAAGLPGLALLALTGLYLASVQHAVRLIPLKTHAYGLGFEAMLFDGVLALVGLAMVIPLFVPSRWRRRARYAVAATGPSTGLLTEDNEAPTQQGSYFAPDQYTSPTIIHDPFPLPGDPAGRAARTGTPSHLLSEVTGLDAAEPAPAAIGTGTGSVPGQAARDQRTSQQVTPL